MMLTHKPKLIQRATEYDECPKLNAMTMCNTDSSQQTTTKKDDEDEKKNSCALCMTIVLLGK